MPTDIRVLIVEDDPYARDCMALLLARDWRTRVIGEAGSEAEVTRLLAQPVDVILLDTEVPDDRGWLFRLAERMRKLQHRPVILCTGTCALYEVLRGVLRGGFGGYILKGEVLYALASAVTRAATGRWVITPGVQQLAEDRRLTLPEETVMLSGTGRVTGFTPRESEIARLAILFSQPKRDLADELQIRPDEVGKLVSRVYEKLGLRDILDEEVSPEGYFDDPLMVKRFRAAREKVAECKQAAAGTRKPKVSDMETLAFHLLTVPEVNRG